MPLPPNVSAGLQRDMARLGFVSKCREQGLARGGNARVHAVWDDLLKLQLARSFRREVKRANGDLDLLAVFGWLAFEEP